MSLQFSNPFKKNPPPAPVSDEARSVRDGFFSTSAIEDKIFSDVPTRVKNAMAKSFQRTHNDLKAIDQNGNEVTTQDFAMDSAIQESKFVNNHGGFLPLQQLEWYGSQGFIGWQLCAILSQNWLIDKCCTMPGKDAIRHWFDIGVNDGTEVKPEVFQAIKKLDKRFKLKKNLLEFVKNGKIFGIRHMMFLVDGIDYSLPFNIDGVRPGSYRGMIQIDPYWMAPELDRAAAANPASKEFYDPTWWRVNGIRIHKSHFVIMRNGDEVPDILKPAYYYGGIPTPQKIYERVYAAERTANEAPLLAMTKRLTTLKVDITEAMKDMDVFSARMKEWQALQNSFGIKVIGLEEEVDQKDTSLTGLDETIMTQFQLVSAAANLPATKLLGTTPKGFNSSGDYETESYHEELESIQENELSEVVERHHMLVIRSIICPQFGMQPFDVDISWNPVNSPTDKEMAEINDLKAKTDLSLSALGAIDGFDARQRIIKDRDSGYNGIPDIIPDGPGDRDAEQENAQGSLEEPVNGKVNNNAAQDASDFDPIFGTLGGARIITHQRFLDDSIVQRKIADRDFTVNVTPPFYDQGKQYCMVIDGHHSLAAAVRTGNSPHFVTEVPRDVVFNPITGQATDHADA